MRILYGTTMGTCETGFHVLNSVEFLKLRLFFILYNFMMEYFFFSVFVFIPFIVEKNGSQTRRRGFGFFKCYLFLYLLSNPSMLFMLQPQILVLNRWMNEPSRCCRHHLLRVKWSFNCIFIPVAISLWLKFIICVILGSSIAWVIATFFSFDYYFYNKFWMTWKILKN